MNQLPTPNAVRRSNRYPSYATLWRIHFYAGIVCIPFVIVLSLTGTLFLFRPQIESWQEQSLDQLPARRTAVDYATQVRASVAATGGRFTSLEVRSEPPQHIPLQSATRVIVESQGQRHRVYVDPSSGQVLHSVVEEERFICVVRRLHGELWLGNRGSYLVELVASWTIIMVVTGMALWMPRQVRAAGVLYPRLRQRGKAFWKDLHSVIGFWASALIVGLIATGLPWSTFWGDYFKNMRRWTGTVAVSQDWEGGHHAKPAARPPEQTSTPSPNSYALSQLNDVAAFAMTLDWLPPVTIQPPTDGDSVWTIQSETANRPARQSLRYHVDDRHVIGHNTFAKKHWLDRIVGHGIALHEGQWLVGTRWNWINQAVALSATIGLMTLSASGLWLWWRRRGPAALRTGLVPPAATRPAMQESVSTIRLLAVGSIAVMLAIYLPLFAASAILIAIVDRWLLPRIPLLSDWLGRSSADASSGTQSDTQWCID